ncbi:MAG: Asp/Glu racemase [Pseudomonadota bacterium]
MSPHPHLGLIALQSDRTIEDDMRRLLPLDVSLLVSRVPSDVEVSEDTLARMHGALTGAAALFPHGHQFSVVGYGCTSASAVIGPDGVAQQIGAGTDTAQVTDPLSALIAACGAAHITRLALLSPYVAPVSDRLRHALQQAGIATPAFASFDEANEAAVAQISADAIRTATLDMMAPADVDAVFLSCTNLRTLDVIAPLQEALGVPVLSSNLVLAWDMLRHAGRAVGPPDALL